MYCKLCGVSCSSDYNYREHIAGRKHRARQAQQQSGGGGSSIGGIGSSGPRSAVSGIGTCFYFKEGRCWKGAACTYLHVEAGGSDSKRKFSSTSSTSATSSTSTSTTTTASASKAKDTSLVASTSALPPPGCCFAFWQRGSCYKGSSCTYKHIRSGDTGMDLDDRPTSKASVAAPSNNSSDLITEVMLTKGGTMATRKSSPPKDNANSAVASPGPADTPNSSDKNGKKLAPIFCKPIKSTPTPPKSKSPPKKPKYTFPAKYLNAFKGKRNVNLFIQDGLVVWEFAYDLTIMSAIKEHIKGRAWNKNIGVKGHWTCPLESLPEAIALYEHMGRKADSGLKKRAAEIEKAFGGASASDAIKMIIRFSLDEHLAESERQCDQAPSTESSQILDRPEPSFGSAKLTFLYDAEVVSVLKMLPPSERSYDPSTKAWTVDILAIPAAIDHLGTLGYTPSRDLQDVVTSIVKLVSTLYGESIDQISTTNTAEDIEVTVKDEPNEESSPSVPGLAPTFSEDSAASVGDDLGIADNTADTTASGAGVKANDSDNNIHQLETAIKGVMSAISKCSGKAGTFSRSDHGDSKRQRLTSSQKSWARRRMGYDDDEDYGYGYGYDFDDDDSDDEDDFFGYSTFFRRDRFASFARNRFDSIKVAKSTKPADCDCGRPDKTIGGIHTCRYFGTFHCRCGNRWTSAYCWKGEKQACRGCNTESLPIKKEPLKNKEGRGVPGGGHHDTARCEMCRKLGYDCSSGY